MCTWLLYTGKARDSDRTKLIKSFHKLLFFPFVSNPMLMHKK